MKIQITNGSPSALSPEHMFNTRGTYISADGQYLALNTNSGRYYLNTQQGTINPWSVVGTFSQAQNFSVYTGSVTLNF